MKQGLKPENHCFLLSPVLLTVMAWLVLRVHFCTYAGGAPLILAPELWDTATMEKKNISQQHIHTKNKSTFCSLSPFELQMYFVFSKNDKLALSR